MFFSLSFFSIDLFFVRRGLHDVHRLRDVKRISIGSSNTLSDVHTVGISGFMCNQRVSRIYWTTPHEYQPEIKHQTKSQRDRLFMRCVNRKSLISIFRIDFTSFVICLLFLNHLVTSHTKAQLEFRRNRNRTRKKVKLHQTAFFFGFPSIHASKNHKINNRM